ncbi:MFS transporter [Pseudonocardia cypriaca]|uniref:Putative MFS family arabinose efflux permease n=1 Tax=Pseudonocardia cypriaca TaxID=882449 RepID=A0A543FV38_9PSEU|nr:MFS transporter [Pseudonocardia cypriaca]TQM37604.1 putative MFS family arabinose efflux permease [Pseudonocardia cypriaca]
MQTSYAPPPAPPASRRHGRGFWLIAYLFTVTMASSTLPTPLYPLYQREDGFGALMVTVVFATYAVGVLAALFLGGHISDWVGRRRMLVLGLLVGIVSSATFALSTALPALLAGRLLSGVSVGLITATATAHLADLDGRARPGQGLRRAEVVATAANLGGLGLGPLVSGLLAELTSSPLRVPYVVSVVLLAIGLAALAVVPETVERPDPMPAYRPQRTGVAPEHRSTFVGAATASVVAFAVFGLFTSLAPLVLTTLFDSGSRVMAGLAALLVFGSAAAAQIPLHRVAAHRQLVTGLAVMAVGVVVLVLAVHLAVLALFLAGGALAGAGAGITFKGSMSTVLATAAENRRGESVAALFLSAYVGLTVPVLGLGFAAQSLPVTVALYAFAAVLLLALAFAGWRTVTARAR